MVFAKEAQPHNDRVVASTQEEIRRLARNGNGSQPEAASITSGLSIIGKIIGRGALTLFGRVEGEIHASNVVIAEGAQMVGDVVAEELTVGGNLKGTIRANRVKINSTGVVERRYFPSNTGDRGECSVRGSVAPKRKCDRNAVARSNQLKADPHRH
jgi:hypothetical protein